MEAVKSFARLYPFHNILKPLGILNKVLQEDELCIVREIEAMIATKRKVEELKAKQFEDSNCEKGFDMDSTK